MKQLGIIGGLGPMATAYFLELIVRMTAAERDQDHLPAIILNYPDIPDRTAYVFDHSLPSPVPRLMEAARTLEALGACAIAVPCITSHCFYEELAASVSIPWINAVAETARTLKEEGVRRVGILATSGTVRTGLFQGALEEAGISWEIPDEIGQAAVMHLIYDNVKAVRPVEMPVFEQVTASLRERGCEALILGCTELSLIKRDERVGEDCLDVLEVLARAAVRLCGKGLNPQWERLLGQKAPE